MRPIRSGLFLALVLPLLGTPASLTAEPVAVPVVTAPVSAFEPQHPDKTRFGPLRFLGGLQIDSPDGRFGGLSGLEISADGTTILMVSDLGDLFHGHIETAADGSLIGLTDATRQRLPGEDGKPLTDKYAADAESLRAIRSGEDIEALLVGFERDNRILRYPLTTPRPDGLPTLATPTALPLPPEAANLPYNKGFEAVAVLPQGAPNAGAVVAFAESVSADGDTTIPGYLITPEGTRDLALARTGGFDVTDAVALDNGDLLILERRFNILLGVAMRLRRITAEELDGPQPPQQPISGEVLFTAGMAYAIDNMEGLAVHTDAAGRTILTIVSDDNFSALQRTLLLQFELLPSSGN